MTGHLIPQPGFDSTDRQGRNGSTPAYTPFEAAVKVVAMRKRGEGEGVTPGLLSTAMRFPQFAVSERRSGAGRA